MNFPDTSISKDPDLANYQNYLAWQAQTAARRRDSRTQFNMFQTRALERMAHQAQYKVEAERESEATKDMVERRLSQACNCENCYTKIKSRSNSEPSVIPSSPTQSVRSRTCSLTRSSSQSPPGTTVRGPTSPSSRNSLIASSPPRSRHHKRRAKSMAE